MKKLIGLLSLIGLIAPYLVSATDFSSTNFTVKDPVIEGGGGRSTSANFQLIGTIPYIAPTVGSSASFGLKPGFVAFSGITLPVLTASDGSGNGEVNLSWTAATGVSGLTYEFGYSTVSGGPYSYSSPQSGLTGTASGLSTSQTYYFVIRVKDGSSAIVGISAEVSATPATVTTGSGGSGPGSSYQPPASPDASQGGPVEPTVPPGASVTPPAVPPTKPGIIETIFKPIFPGLFPEPPQPIYVPIETYVPKVTPFAFRRPQNLLPPEPIKEFALRPLPTDIVKLAGSFPQIGKLFKEVGITKFNDLQKLRSISLSIPGLTDVLTLPTIGIEGGTVKRPRDLRVAELSPELKKKFPTGVLFTSLAGGTINIGGKFSLTPDGRSQELIRTVSGKTMELSIRPSFPARSVMGYLVFKSKSRAEMDISELSWVDRVFGVSVAKAAISVPVETALVMNQFEFLDDDGDGIYTASIDSPVVAGDYEIITIITYQDEARGTQALRMLTVVDPEGYVYESSDGKEIRIPGAIATINWLNPETSAYEIWPASQYQQENPQVTGVTGAYSFLVPPGLYQLKVSAPGYSAYEGKPFEVKAGDSIHENIELRTRTWFLNLVDWRTLGLIAIALLVLYNFYKDRIRDRREALLLKLQSKGL